ncbi:TPA: hypothetical protein ACX6Q7_001545 [Photobacterium damselae]
MINKLRNTFDGKVIKKFAKKKITVKFENEITFEEEHLSAALRTLSIICNDVLINQQLSDTLILEADFPSGEHSKYSTFVKKDAFFLAKQCDFFIFHQKQDHLYVAICDMKSSRGGDDDRCKQQIEHAKFFLTYILNSALHSECYRSSVSQPIKGYTFIKLLFIPKEPLPVALPLPLDLDSMSCESEFKTDGTTNFHMLDMDGNSARELWSTIERRFPN